MGIREKVSKIKLKDMKFIFIVAKHKMNAQYVDM